MFSNILQNTETNSLDTGPVEPLPQQCPNRTALDNDQWTDGVHRCAPVRSVRASYGNRTLAVSECMCVHPCAPPPPPFGDFALAAQTSTLTVATQTCGWFGEEGGGGVVDSVYLHPALGTASVEVASTTAPVCECARVCVCVWGFRLGVPAAGMTTAHHSSYWLIIKCVAFGAALHAHVLCMRTHTLTHAHSHTHTHHM